MTVEKKEIIMPAWLFNLIVSIIGFTFIFYGVMASANAKLERATSDIETLRQEKVSKDEFNMVLEKLNSIDTRLNSLIDKKSENQRGQ